jgi:hypothetical protein
MTIGYTSILKLRTITYLHDGEEAADAFNETLTIVDTIFSYLVAARHIETDENAGTDTPIVVSMVIDRATGKPVMNRLALPF